MYNDLKPIIVNRKVEMEAKGVKFQIIKEVNLDGIEAVRNKIPLCDNFHIQFYKYLIEIHPEFLTLVISNEISNENNMMQGGTLFSQLHGRKVEIHYDNYSHRPRDLLEYRHTSLESKLNKKFGDESKYYYCLLCPVIYSSLEELQDHLEICKVSKSC